MNNKQLSKDAENVSSGIISVISYLRDEIESLEETLEKKDT